MLKFQKYIEFDDFMKRLSEFIIRHALAGDTFLLSGFLANLSPDDNSLTVRFSIDIRHESELWLMATDSEFKKIMNSQTTLLDSINELRDELLIGGNKMSEVDD